MAQPRGGTPHYGQAIAVAMRAGNVVQPGAGGSTTYGELSATSKQEQLRHAALLKRVEAERRARKIVVPTNDGEVRGMLRKLGHPVRLFGESLADVRERLREILARIEIEGEERELVAALLAAPDPSAPGDETAVGIAGSIVRKETKHDNKSDVYTPATQELVAARRKVAAFSFPRASKRVEAAKRRRDDPEVREERERDTVELYGSLTRLALAQSQFGDPRPLARVRVGPSRKVVATAAWSGGAAVWDLEACACIATVSGHKDRATGLAWSPRQDKHVILTGGADGIAMLWDCSPAAGSTAMDEEEDGERRKPAAVPEEARLLATLEGHSERLGNVAFHPQGGYCATTSFDHTWRLWDVETTQELLLQDGHTRETYSCAFQPDGALIATGDFGGVCHVWDVRSGKLVWSALGHGKKVLCAAWSPDGYQLATASDDNTCRVWELRRKTCAYTLPAHSSLISDLCWSPSTGEALATSGFDGKIKVWSTRDWSSLTSLSAHDGKAMSCDFVDDTTIVSAGFDRTFKIWQPTGADGGLSGYE